MSQITWLSEYSVGIEEMDFHHKKIFTLMNNLQKMIESGNKKAIEDAILGVRDYANYHLLTEEAYLKKSKYKKYKQHVRAHDKYRRTVDNLIVRKDDLDFDPGEVLIFLKQWWTNHILKVDKQYQQTLNEAGIV